MPSTLVAGLGYVRAKFHRTGEVWLADILLRPGIPWGEEAHANLAWGLPPGPDTWERLSKWGSDTTKLYWTRTPMTHLADPDRDAGYAAKALCDHGRWYSALYLAVNNHRRRKADGGKHLAIPVETLIRILQEVPRHQPKEEWYPPSLQAIGYFIGDLLDALEEAGVESPVLVGLELVWMPVLDENRRGLKSLQAALSEDPKLFVELLTLAFRPDGESPQPLSDDERARSRRAYEVLQAWKRVPGTIGASAKAPAEKHDGNIVFEVGTIDEDRLMDWLTQAHQLAQDANRSRAFNIAIGQMFASAPAASDGVWPHVAVRNAIERFASVDLEQQMQLTLYNSRGAHFRAHGGQQERDLARKFRAYSEHVRDRWPRTTAFLTEIAEHYELQGRHEDARAEFEEFE